jgi:hypothetical protein
MRVREGNVPCERSLIMHRRIAALALVLSLSSVGCRRGPRPASDLSITSDPALHAATSDAQGDVGDGAGSVDPAPAPKPMCPALVATTKAAFDRAVVDWYGDAGAPSSPIGFCADSDAGAWLVDLPSALGPDAPTAQYALEARYVVTFVRRDGTRVQHVPKETLANYGVRTSPTPFTHDYDGDGTPELYVETKEDGDEGHEANQIELLTFKGGSIAPYASASTIEIESAKDVDGDGAPDLITLAGYDETLEGCASGFPYDRLEPMFVAHAHADGTFSLDDAVAKAHAATWCTAAPTTIASSLEAICARLRAVDVPRERARVAASCTDFSCEDSMAGKAQKKTASEDCARRRAFFDRTPPLTLP